MTNDISKSFVTQYQAEVHSAYQQGGSKLRGCVRLKTEVVGSSAAFPKIAKGSATQKTRHGTVVAMNLDHTMVECALEDWYAPDYIDKLDEYKVQHDERHIITQSGANAIGRKIDSIIIDAAIKTLPTSQVVGSGATLLTLEDILAAYALLNTAEVPDDGQRFAVVGPAQWNALLQLKQFSSSDYAGADFPWLKSSEARKWLNTTWVMHSGLPQTGTGETSASKCIWFHRSALGLAENSVGVISEINYVPEKVSYLANNMIGAGSCRIDDSGVVVLHSKNSWNVAVV